MIRVLSLSLREFRANWRRNAVFGTILLVSVGVQLYTALAAAASTAAVQTYGAAVYGYAETYRATLDTSLTTAELHRFNERLAEIGSSYPWFRPATAVDLQGYVRVNATPDPAIATPLSLRLVSPDWRLLTPSIPDSDVWRSVSSNRRMGAALMLEQATAARLQFPGPQAATILVNASDIVGQGSTATGDAGGSNSADPDNGGAQASAGPGGAAAGAPPERASSSANIARIAVADVPIFGTYEEPNKSLAADALGNQILLDLVHAGPQPVQLFWRCTGQRCADSSGLLSMAAATVGTTVGGTQRIDLTNQFRPVLEQQKRDGNRFALIVLVLGGVAVAIVSTAFVEVRAPQFATLRALGATRPAVGAIALIENLCTALVVGVAAVCLGWFATFLDPNWFNRIPQVRLTDLAVPVAVYGKTVALTLLVGLLSGLVPALRAYRSVRTH